MPSSTISPKYGDTETTVFTLVSSSATGSKYQVSGRDLATPKGIEITRRLTQPSAQANDHIQLRIFHTERNATTMKLATAQVLVDISCPKDTSILTQAVQAQLLGCLSSILNDYAAVEDDRATNTALLSGMDL